MEFEIVDDSIRAGFKCDITFEITVPGSDEPLTAWVQPGGELWIYADKFKDAEGKYFPIDISTPDSPFYQLGLIVNTACNAVEDLPHPDIDWESDAAEDQEEENSNYQTDVSYEAVHDFEAALQDEDIIAAFEELLKV